MNDGEQACRTWKKQDACKNCEQESDKIPKQCKGEGLQYYVILSGTLKKLIIINLRTKRKSYQSPENGVQEKHKTLLFSLIFLLPMRILHTVLTRDLSGTERHAAELCNALAEQGHEVVLAIRRDAEAYGQGYSIRNWVGEKVRVVEIPRRLPARAFLRLMLTFRPQVAHTHHGRDSRYLAMLKRLLTPLRLLGYRPPALVTTLHIGYSRHDHAHHNMVISLNARQVRETRERGYTGKMVTIGNWVMPHALPDAERLSHLRQRFGLNDFHYVFGAVARLVPEKGLDTLIEAFRASSLPPSARLLILGEGVERKRLHQLAGEELGQRILMPGFRPDVRDFYGLFDCFVLPSRFEPFGLVLLEAMEAGCPIIATLTDGPKEIFQRITPPGQEAGAALSHAPGTSQQASAGAKENYPLLIPVEDGISLARGLESAFSQGRQRVSYPLDPFRMETRVKEIEQVYRELLEE
jgi:glycosyltransferase involved in cell wall biosynthesis